MSDKPADRDHDLERLTKVVEVMRARGITKIKAPWWFGHDYGMCGGQFELELGPDPAALVLPVAEEAVEAREPPKRGPDGLTEDEARVAYNHHRRT